MIAVNESSRKVASDMATAVLDCLRAILPMEAVVVYDKDTSDEALYLDGRLVFSECTVYACDLAREAGGKPIRFSHIAAVLPDDEVWPDLLDDVELVEEEGGAS